MLIMPRFQKSLMVEQFQRNYLKHCYFITGLPNPVGIWVSLRGFFIFSFLFFFFFAVSVKVLPVTPLLSGVFVHSLLCIFC